MTFEKPANLKWTDTSNFARAVARAFFSKSHMVLPALSDMIAFKIRILAKQSKPPDTKHFSSRQGPPLPRFLPAPWPSALSAPCHRRGRVREGVRGWRVRGLARVCEHHEAVLLKLADNFLPNGAALAERFAGGF